MTQHIPVHPHPYADTPLSAQADTYCQLYVYPSSISPITKPTSGHVPIGITHNQQFHDQHASVVYSFPIGARTGNYKTARWLSVHSSSSGELYLCHCRFYFFKRSTTIPHAIDIHRSDTSKVHRARTSFMVNEIIQTLFQLLTRHYLSFTITQNVLKINPKSYRKLCFSTYSR